MHSVGFSPQGGREKLTQAYKHKTYSKLPHFIDFLRLIHTKNLVMQKNLRNFALVKPKAVRQPLG